MSTSRQLFSSGSVWEPVVGYSRAVRVGAQVFIAGTTASSPDGAVGETAAEQTREILTRLVAVLEQAGARLDHVVRSRIYLTSMADFDAVGRVHGEFFGDIRPAATAVEVGALAAPDLLVEIELDAVIHD
ncbi:RidA family protein [uncultured Schumannella sp.]|jgi:enamine deaminase RidA (YjgF/YER057c/UK114 family)|uniref:RidA family protein n=1 Tax=uncultured Schumannella sp. TaxID=1195956 RepID=UPI0025D8ED6B|nr:RidA family protein [uncultured Schumannella sp.]